MRIVTRSDFDGIVCAALLYEAENITKPIKWVEPDAMQKGLVEICSDDIVANLPFHPACALWFDHHYTNQPNRPFHGLFKMAPSAAGVVHEYYRERFQRNYDELIRETDKIDSADLTREEVLCPEKFPYILLAMTLAGNDPTDEPYWNQLVQFLRHADIQEVMNDPEVKARCQAVIKQNSDFKDILKAFTRMEGHVSVTDFRSLAETPAGNRFLVYSLFPDAIVSIKIRNDKQNPGKIVIGAGHSIFNRLCQVNVGLMLSKFEGGGHRGAGSCTVAQEDADECLGKILDILLKNEPND
jgi:oligoribonuclease NrnB/cAMP/cGMP phosphodiesterase (DHH superfamily)